MKQNANLDKAIAQAVVQASAAKKVSPAKKPMKPPQMPLGGNAGAVTPPMGTDPLS